MPAPRGFSQGSPSVRHRRPRLLAGRPRNPSAGARGGEGSLGGSAPGRGCGGVGGVRGRAGAAASGRSDLRVHVGARVSGSLMRHAGAELQTERDRCDAAAPPVPASPLLSARPRTGRQGLEETLGVTAARAPGPCTRPPASGEAAQRIRRRERHGDVSRRGTHGDVSHACHTCVRPKACVSEVSQSQEDTPVFHFCEVPSAGFRDSRWVGGARGWGRGASVSAQDGKFWRWMVGKAAQPRR